MNLPISNSSIAGLSVAAILGLVFGVLLNKGRVTDYNVILNLFRLKDLTVVKIMLTAILVGGIGVSLMMQAGWLEGYHIKPANLLGVVLGSSLFGIGMALYGYCPGTAIAAMATGRTHAFIGFVGMIFGGILYALSFSWLDKKILSVWQFGQVRLPEVSGLPSPFWWLLLSVFTGILFLIIHRIQKPKTQ